jgi:hypothetical protein
MDESPKFTSFGAFQILGYFLGGMIPVIMYLILELCGLNLNNLPRNCIGLFLILAFLGVLIGSTAFLVDKIYPENHKLFHKFFLAQAIFSIVLIHLLVLYTGGPKSSVFANSYLYLPAIVGYTYGRGKKLYWAVWFLSFSYFLNLFWNEGQKNSIWNSIVVWEPSIFKPLDKSDSFTAYDSLIYGFVFAIQILVTTFIATKSSRYKELKSKTEIANAQQTAN